MDKRYEKELPKLFSKNSLKGLIYENRIEYFHYIIQESHFYDAIPLDISFMDIYNGIYKYLSANYRCEYIYKNVIIDDLIKANHHIKDSTVISEFTSLNSIADLLVLNGTSTVYEIKTELDSLDKLEKQLESYGYLYEYTNVVCSRTHLDKVLKIIPEHSGVILLEYDDCMSTIKEATSNIERLESTKLFDILRRSEYLSIIEKYMGIKVDVPNGRVYQTCKDLFEKIPPCFVHDEMIVALKNRYANDWVVQLDSIPHCLYHAVITSGFTELEMVYLADKLNSQFQPLN